MQDFFKSKKWTAVLAVISALAVMLAIFEAGVYVGFRKAAFADRMSGEYAQVFGSGGGRLGDIDQNSFPSAHGVAGSIINIALPYAFIKGSDNVERTIHVGSSTAILKYRDAISAASLAEGDFIVVIGSPDASSSDINANFIRVIPAPPATGVGK